MCSYAGCYTPTLQGFCDRHKQYGLEKAMERQAIAKQKQRWSDSPNDVLYRSSKWRNLRKLIIQRDECCVLCGTVDNLQVHHINKAQDLFFDGDNLMVLCLRCHSKQTRTEQTRKNNVSNILR